MCLPPLKFNTAQQDYSDSSCWLTGLRFVSLTEICLQRRCTCLHTSPRDTALCEQRGQGVPDINLEQRSEVTEHYCQPLAFYSILSSAFSMFFLNCLWHNWGSGPFHLQIKLPLMLRRSKANLLFYLVQSLQWQGPNMEFFSARHFFGLMHIWDILTQSGKCPFICPVNI